MNDHSSNESATTPAASMRERPEPLGPRRGLGARIWPLAVLAAAAAMIYFVVISATPPGGEGTRGGQHPAAGQAMPSLDLKPLTGTDQALSLDAVRGEVVLVNFWGTWCPPCRMELPHLLELHRKLADRDDFRLALVSCGGGWEEVEQTLRYETEAFALDTNLSAPTYWDEGGRLRRQLQRLRGFGPIVFPTTMLLDRQGTIRGIWQGYGPGEEREVERLALELLNAPAEG